MDHPPCATDREERSRGVPPPAAMNHRARPRGTSPLGECLKIEHPRGTSPWVKGREALSHTEHPPLGEGSRSALPHGAPPPLGEGLKSALEEPVPRRATGEQLRSEVGHRQAPTTSDRRSSYCAEFALVHSALVKFGAAHWSGTPGGRRASATKASRIFSRRVVGGCRLDPLPRRARPKSTRGHG